MLETDGLTKERPMIIIPAPTTSTGGCGAETASVRQVVSCEAPSTTKPTNFNCAKGVTTTVRGCGGGWGCKGEMGSIQYCETE